MANFNISRRFFLQASGSVLAALTVADLARAQSGPSQAAGAPATQPSSLSGVTKNKTLVVIFLRGGADGLNLVVPHAEPEYYKLRPNLAIPRPDKTDPLAALDLDGTFGLHPGLAKLNPWFDQKLCTAVHAVGYDKNTRSHFEEQDTWETGVVGKTLATDGWLNRHLASSEGHSTIRALAIGATLPRCLRGSANAYAVRDINEFSLPGNKDRKDAAFTALAAAYGPPGSDMSSRAPEADMVNSAGQETLHGIKTIQGIMQAPYKPAAEYPKNAFAHKLQQAARLIKSNIGLEVVQIDLDGWDTHQYQGTHNNNGPFFNLASTLATGMDAFAKDLGDRLNDTLILTLSDFGRTVAENGTAGTDHGWGNALFAMGGPVHRSLSKSTAGPIQGKWPGLANEQLHEKRDLQHTTDFRDVIASAVSNHLGNKNLDKVLPNYTPKPLSYFA
jgi:uncharacterized protein (DUF1501 family)